MYQVLARKYRPRNFAQLVGQTHVARALTSALARNRLHHAYLFTGTRGVGKTTIARILSKCLNCETGITATPCEVCATCMAINQGRFIDLIEIDAASRTRVEDTRELLDNVPYAPTQGRYKVYLIDEVHMLSTHSFNALLKTLEEPPDHVKFLLATTDPQKLPITVVSRCLQFTLRPLQQQEIHDHLQHVLNLEQISSDDSALWQLSEAAQGSLRDALSLTDQAIAYGQGQLQGAQVQEMLGLLDKAQLLHLLQAIHRFDTAGVSRLLGNLASQAVDLKAVLDQLITLLHQIALLQVLPEVPLQGTSEYQQQLRHLAGRIARSDVQLYYQIGVQGRQDLKLAVSVQQGFDMCILRMLAFKPLAPNEQPLAALQQPAHPQGALAGDSASASAGALQPDVSLAGSNGRPVVVDTPAPDNPDREEPVPGNPVIDKPAIHKPAINEPAPDQPVVDTPAKGEPVLITMPPKQAALNHQLMAPAAATEPSGQGVGELNSPGGELQEQPRLTNTLTEDDALQQPAASNSSACSISAADPAVNAVSAPYEACPPPHDIRPPQALLQYPAVALEGQWTVEKWEYWLREANMSPALRNLAQHGIAQGEIGKHSYFRIAPEHQLMASELIDGLNNVLKQQWPDSTLTLEFVQPQEATPLQRKALRMAQAQEQAEKLFAREPVITALMQQFNAQVAGVELKP